MWGGWWGTRRPSRAVGAPPLASGFLGHDPADRQQAGKAGGRGTLGLRAAPNAHTLRSSPGSYAFDPYDKPEL